MERFSALSGLTQVAATFSNREWHPVERGHVISPAVVARGSHHVVGVPGPRKSLVMLKMSEWMVRAARLSASTMTLKLGEYVQRVVIVSARFQYRTWRALLRTGFLSAGAW